MLRKCLVNKRIDLPYIEFVQFSNKIKREVDSLYHITCTGYCLGSLSNTSFEDYNPQLPSKTAKERRKH